MLPTGALDGSWLGTSQWHMPHLPYFMAVMCCNLCQIQVLG